MFGPRPAKTHTELMRVELAESLDHLIQAATHAAGGVGASVAPRYVSARQRVAPSVDKVRSATTTSWAAFAPMMAAAREGAASAIRAADEAKTRSVAKTKSSAKTKRDVSKASPPRFTKESGMSRNRSGLLVGVLAAGAAAGAAGAVVVRRRNKARWERYEADATEPLDDGVSAALDPDEPAAVPGYGKLSSKTGKAADRVNDWAAAAKSTVSDWSGAAKSAATRGTGEPRTPSAAIDLPTEPDDPTDIQPRHLADRNQAAPGAAGTPGADPGMAGTRSPGDRSTPAAKESRSQPHRSS